MLVALHSQNRGLGEADKPKKCGWICRNINTIAFIVTTINPAAGAAIKLIHMAAMETFGGYRVMPGQSETPEDLPMTEQEAKTLDTWVDTWLKPFMNQISELYQSSKTASNAVKAEIFTNILTQLCYIQHFSGQNTTGLSTNATKNRAALVNYFTTPVREQIFADAVGFSLNNTTINSANFNAQNVGLNPMSGTIPCQVLQLQPKQVGTANPNDQFIGQGGQIKSVKDSVNLDLSVDTLQAKPAETASITQSIKPSWWSNWMFIPLAFVGYKIIK